MSDLIRRDDVIATVYNQSDDEGLWSITAKEMENIINSLPSVEPDVPDINVGDMINRQEAIKAVARAIWHYPNLSLLNNYHFAHELAEDALKRLPFVEPNNKLKKIADLVDGTIDHFDLDDAMDLLYQIKDVCKKEMR